MPISVLSINNGNADLSVVQPVTNSDKLLTLKKLKMVLKAYWLSTVFLAKLLKSLSVYEVNIGFCKDTKIMVNRVFSSDKPIHQTGIRYKEWLGTTGDRCTSMRERRLCIWCIRHSLDPTGYPCLTTCSVLDTVMVFVLVFASQTDEVKHFLRSQAKLSPTISQKPGGFLARILTHYTIMERTEIGLERGLSSILYFLFFISVCAEAYNPDEEEDDAESRIIHPKTDDQRNRLQEACKDILLFKNLDPEQMSQVLDAMFEKLVEGGEHVIDQGDDGDNFYVIDRGTYDIYVKCDGVGRCVGTYDNRGSFGELALMYNTPRAATIIATSPGAIWGLDRITFRRIIVKNNAKKRRMYESFIESLPFLKSLEVSERLKVVDVIGTKVYKDGEQIIAQGDSADSFFIVESGEVRIIMTRKGKQEVEENGAVEIARCSRGQYFGELALVTNKPRAASAFALGTVKCLVMDVQAFERLLGPCMEILKRNIANYEEQLVALFGTNMDIADPSA
ncbi:PREDICTED: cAMP-dependent protein kinase type II-beta regulatory subunit [Charadrius vociferus]|uniref:cAMP-dependent protein kinase type II-beta regulatory subunit n=1 Tax=Charadrius vociferus TaxID=50402 RepID=UPI0005212572|nr:PREDICTED: cAMP-dependent protein kinase type II-beta regulatory subunit [Charadrius vociferus]